MAIADIMEDVPYQRMEGFDAKKIDEFTSAFDKTIAGASTEKDVRKTIDFIDALDSLDEDEGFAPVAKYHVSMAGSEEFSPARLQAFLSELPKDPGEGDAYSISKKFISTCFPAMNLRYKDLEGNAWERCKDAVSDSVSTAKQALHLKHYIKVNPRRYRAFELYARMLLVILKEGKHTPDHSPALPEIPPFPNVATEEDFAQFHADVMAMVKQFSRFLILYMMGMLILFLIAVL